VRDLTRGIDGTGVKAGIIKCGTEYNNFNESGRKLVRVAAAAHRETGRPVITHTTAGTMGYEQASLLIELGVEPHRIALSHMDRNLDAGDHLRVTKLGAYVGYDCFGKAKYGPDSARLALLREMLDAGAGRRILIGNDLGRPSYWKSYGGGPGLDFVLTEFKQRFLASGFSEVEWTTLVQDNPRRFFSGEA
jgi:5-phospho-D-xylono-1,4-lactonase